MPKFAANLSMEPGGADACMLFKEVPFLERFQAAAAAGFRGVEFLFPYGFPAAELRGRLDDSGLALVMFNLPPGDWASGERGLAALPGREAEFRDGVGQALEYARALDCPQVHAMAGVVPADASPARCLETYVENLRFAARALAEHGVRLLIEPISAAERPGFFLNRMAQAQAVLEDVADGNLWLLCDLYHVQRTEGNLAETLVRTIGRIAHIQIAGVPGRHEPDTGEINYRFLFDLLDGQGYDGWIGCEYRPRGTTLDGLGWFGDYG